MGFVKFLVGDGDMDVSKNRGKTHQNGWLISWKTPIKMDDLGGPPLFLETPIC